MVQIGYVIVFQGLLEVIDGVGVVEGQVVGLILKVDFDGVEGVFDVFVNDVSYLWGVSQL